MSDTDNNTEILTRTQAGQPDAQTSPTPVEQDRARVAALTAALSGFEAGLAAIQTAMAKFGAGYFKALAIPTASVAAVEVANTLARQPEPAVNQSALFGAELEKVRSAVQSLAEILTALPEFGPGHATLLPGDRAERGLPQPNQPSREGATAFTLDADGIQASKSGVSGVRPWQSSSPGSSSASRSVFNSPPWELSESMSKMAGSQNAAIQAAADGLQAALEQNSQAILSLLNRTLDLVARQDREFAEVDRKLSTLSARLDRTKGQTF